MWVHDLRDADEHCGGKAQGLARLIRAGLPVPSGFVIDDRAFRSVVGDIEVATEDLGHALEQAAQRIASAELPVDFVAEVSRRAAELGERVMVRSSATIEDSAAGAAAGVFSSRAAVPIAELWDAIRSVWTSALTPLAAAYARKRGGEIAIGVILQEYVTGDLVTIYTRPPGDPASTDMLVQSTELRREPRRDEFVRVERAIGAAQGADIELVADKIVQARPIVHPAPSRLQPAPPVIVKPLEDGRVWTWDVAHNPDPLSIAQQELVSRVAEAGAYSLRIAGGYLYTSPREHVESQRSAAEIEAELETLLADPPQELEAALDRYDAFYRVWSGELAPLISRMRPKHPGARPSAIEHILMSELSEDEVLARVGFLSPAWDVAVPTYGERSAVVRDAVARARSVARPPPLDPDPIADLAERDDMLFARAQWMVRRALLARGGDDIFWVRFDEHSLAPLELHRRAAANRAAAERAARWQMPLVVGGPPPPEREALRGVGTGPRVSGRVVRFASLASAIAVGPGDVVVTRAVTPALAVLVAGCAALVSETGGLLDHGAALARELGIPCVVGCAHAWSELADGMIVTVDGNRGEVTKT